jgi:hypothetical protein
LLGDNFDETGWQMSSLSTDKTQRGDLATGVTAGLNIRRRIKFRTMFEAVSCLCQSLTHCQTCFHFYGEQPMWLENRA